MERFTKQIRLTYAECDFLGRLRPSAVMRHIQEVAGEHLDAMELPRRQLWNEGFVFLLTRVRLRIARLPLAGETLVLATQPYEPKGAQFFRHVFFMTQAGETLITADTAWVLADPSGHKIYRPSAFPHVLQMARDEYDYSWVRERIRQPETAQEQGTRTVRYSDIDVNMHMNNAVYSDLVLDCLPMELHREYDLREYTIAFIGEACLGDELALCAGSIEPGCWYVGAQKAEGRCFEAESHWLLRE